MDVGHMHPIAQETCAKKTTRDIDSDGEGLSMSGGTPKESNG